MIKKIFFLFVLSVSISATAGQMKAIDIVVREAAANFFNNDWSGAPRNGLDPFADIWGLKFADDDEEGCVVVVTGMARVSEAAITEFWACVNRDSIQGGWEAEILP